MIKANKIGLAVLMTATLAQTGCSTFSSVNMGRNEMAVAGVKQAPSPLEIISQESQKAMNAQMMLTKYRQTYNDTLDLRYRDFDNDKIIVDYIGTPSGVLNSTAIKYGYRYLEFGTKTDLPIVNFTHYYTTPENLVISVDSQLKNLASISIDKQQKIIALTYR